MALGTTAVSIFDIQMQRIKAAWPKIHAVVGPNIIRTLEASGVRKQHSAIWAEMNSKR